MQLILNTNQLGYKPFLSTPVNSIIIGLKNFSHNQFYTVSLKEIPKIVNELKSHNKELYLSINIFALEKDLIKLDSIIDNLINLDIKSFIVSDLGVLNLFKKRNMENRVILDLQTYVTNKYSAKSLLNLGVNRIVLSKEITLKDILEINDYCENKIELLAQGYYPITYSKRPILKCYYKNFNLKKKNCTHFIKEESRDDYYYLLENKNDLSVYNNKQYSLFNHLDELIKNNIYFLRIDTNFLSLDEINCYISFYFKAIKYIEENKLDDYFNLKENFNNQFVFDTPFLYNESFLLKEGK